MPPREKMSNAVHILGCGQLGTAITTGILQADDVIPSRERFRWVVATVNTDDSRARLTNQFQHYMTNKRTCRFDVGDPGDSVIDIVMSKVTILAVPPSEVAAILAHPRVRRALAGHLLISTVAGWSLSALDKLANPDDDADKHPLWAHAAGDPRVHIVRVFPSAATRFGHGVTAIEIPTAEHHHLAVSPEHLALTKRIFNSVGTAIEVPSAMIDRVIGMADIAAVWAAGHIDAIVESATTADEGGLTRELALPMVMQSFAGAVGMRRAGVDDLTAVANEAIEKRRADRGMEARNDAVATEMCEAAKAAADDAAADVAANDTTDDVANNAARDTTEEMGEAMEEE